MIFKLLIILLPLALSFSTYLRKLQDLEELTIQGNTNKQIEVNFPLDQIVSVSISNRSDFDFIKLISKRFKLAVKKSITLGLSNKKTLLEQLRSPFTNQYTLMFYIKQHLVIFEMPNTFLLFKEAEFSFESIKNFQVNGMVKSSSIYSIEDAYIIVAISAEQLVVMNQNLSMEQNNPFNTTQALVIKRIAKDNNQFVTIFNNTLFLLEINEKGKMSIAKAYNLRQKELQIEVSAMERGQSYKKNQQFWILDQNKGVFVMVVSNSLELVSFPILIQKQAGCFQMDTDIQVHAFRLLLTCRSKGNNKFLELTYDNDKKYYPFLRAKESPYDQKCSSDRYMFYKNYIISQQSESLDIFVPDHTLNGKAKYKKHWVTLDGINNFIIRRGLKNESLVVYVAKNGILEKRELQFQKASLIINSDHAVSQKLPVKIQYLCKQQEKQIFQICQTEISLRINIHSNVVSYIQYKSLNIGLILLLVTILTALVLLCRYKYNSIYQSKYQDLKQLTNPQKYQL